MRLPQSLADALAVAVDEQTHLRFRSAVRAVQAWIMEQSLSYPDLAGDSADFFVPFASIPRRRDCNPDDLPGALDEHVSEERLLALSERPGIATDAEWMQYVRTWIDRKLAEQDSNAVQAFSVTPIANAPLPVFLLVKWAGYLYGDMACLGVFRSREEALRQLRTLGLIEDEYQAQPEAELNRAMSVLRKAARD